MRPLQDETLTDLALLDILDFDMDGNMRLNEGFLEAVRRELRAEHAHRAALGYQDGGPLPALRAAVRARALARDGERADVERLADALLRFFPRAWA